MHTLYIGNTNAPPPPLRGNTNLVPHLRVRASMIDHDIRDGLDAVVLEHGQAVTQLGLGSVAGVEVVEVAREVALGRD